MNGLNNVLDVIIVGSGPAGLSAAIYAKRAGLDVLVIEKEYMGAGQIAYSDKVDNYLGIPAVNGFDLGESFRNHALSLGVVIDEGEVTGITPVRNDIKSEVKAADIGMNQACIDTKNMSGLWRTEFSDGTCKFSKTVIYAAGSHHRHLGIKEEEEYVGKGVSYCAVCDGAFYKGKSVVVAGGGNSALGDALYLSDISSDVYLVHRRDEFRADAVTLNKVKERANVHIITGVNIQSLRGEKKLEEVVLSDGQVIKADGLFVAIGMEPETDILKGIVELDEKGYVVASEDCVTSAKGFYVAGDVRTKQLRQVITAAADGANAASQVIKYLK